MSQGERWLKAAGVTVTGSGGVEVSPLQSYVSLPASAITIRD